VATALPALSISYAVGTGPSGDGDQRNVAVVQVALTPVRPTGLGVMVVTLASTESLDRCPPAAAMIVYWCVVPGARPLSVKDVWLAATEPTWVPSRRTR
jgi:hypothetical protein